MSGAVIFPAPRRYSGEYRVVTDRCELPKGMHFVALPTFGAPTPSGALALVEVGDGHLIVGRWFPEIAGCDWILMPELWIQLTGAVPVRVVGLVLVMDTDVVCLN